MSGDTLDRTIAKREAFGVLSLTGPLSFFLATIALVIPASAVEAQAVASPPADAYNSPPLAWQCDVIDELQNKFSVEGVFEMITPENRRAGVENSRILRDSSNRLLGSHKVYMVTPGQGGDAQYNLIVVRPNKLYYHLMFQFYGVGRLGSVYIEEQRLPSGSFDPNDPSWHKVIGVGFCRVSKGSQS